MVTEQEIDEQVAAVEVAESALDRAEAHHATAGSETAVNELRVARAEAHASRDRLRHLRSRYAAEQASSRARAEAEKAFPKKRREALAQQLGDARDEAAHAIAVLDQAAAEALRAVADYTALVQSTARDLQAAGLRHDDGGVEGGAVDGSVYLNSEVWRPASGPDLLGGLVSAAVTAHDRRHPLAVRWRYSGGLVAQAGAEALLKAARR